MSHDPDGNSTVRTEARPRRHLDATEVGVSFPSAQTRRSGMYLRAEILATQCVVFGSEPPPARRRLSPSYWRLWWATAVSRLGDGITVAALPLLSAKLTGDVRHIAGVYAVLHVPYFGLPLVAGALTDRWDRRRTLLVTDVSRAVLLAALGAAIALGWGNIVMAYVVSLGLGVGEVFFRSAHAAIVPAIVDNEDYERANGRLGAVDTVAYDLAGPALGAAAFTVFHSMPFFADAATFLLGGILVWSIGSRFREANLPIATTITTASLRADVRTGLAWLWRHPTLRTMILLTGSINLGLNAVWATLLPFSTDVLNLPDYGFGLMLGGLAVGSIVGSLAADRITTRVGPAWSVRMATVGCALATAGAGLLSNAVAVVAVLGVTGVMLAMYNVVSISTRQAAIPDHLRGRVNAVSLMVIFAGIPVGAMVGGLLADSIGPRAPFMFCGMFLLATLGLSQRKLTDRRLRAARNRIDLTDGAMIRAAT
jgi:MFS family permease